MLGPGRPAKKPSINSVRELTREEVASIPRGRSPAVVQLRDTHHMVARLLALGLRPFQIAERTGYSIARISILSGDPAMQELVASYRNSVDESWREQTDEYFQNAVALRNVPARLLRDRLEEEPDKFSNSQLLAIMADSADRTGYPKRKESVNLNVDFAARLEQAVRRSNEVKTIEHNPEPALGLGASSDPLQPHPDGAVAGAVAQGKSLDIPTPAPLSLAAKYLPQPRRAG